MFSPYAVQTFWFPPLSRELVHQWKPIHHKKAMQKEKIYIKKKKEKIDYTMFWQTSFINKITKRVNTLTVCSISLCLLLQRCKLQN